jgi:hypothetical protein
VRLANERNPSSDTCSHHDKLSLTREVRPTSASISRRFPAPWPAALHSPRTACKARTLDYACVQDSLHNPQHYTHTTLPWVREDISLLFI